MFQELSDGSCLRSLVIEGARSSVDAAFCGFLTAGAETLDLPSEQDHQNHQRYQSPSLELQNTVWVIEHIFAV